MDSDAFAHTLRIQQFGRRPHGRAEVASENDEEEVAHSDGQRKGKKRARDSSATPSPPPLVGAAPCFK